MKAVESVKSTIQASPSRQLQAVPSPVKTDATATSGPEGSKAAKPAVAAKSAESAQAKPVAEVKKNESESTRVTLSREKEPQPNTADRNAKPIEQFKAVSALR